MMRRLTKEQFQVSDWSGGRTVQIAIAPPGALYADRDFLWRVSSATVELDESDFTALPDYDRWIMPLAGEMRLSHNGGAPADLAECEAHAFDGGDATHCWGRCTDFNLMLRKGRCRGRVFALRGEAGEERALDARGALVLYCAEGGATLEACGASLTLNAGEAARVEPAEAEGLTLRFTAPGRVAAAEVREGPDIMAEATQAR